MKYSKELIKIVKENDFKSFWHCFDFLVIAGFPVLESFGIALQEFGEAKIYEKVGFIRFINKSVIVDINNAYRLPSNACLMIGMVDETNIHLAGLYRTYRDWLKVDNNNIYSDIEETCDVIQICEPTKFIMDYLMSVSKLHFGFEAFKYNEDGEWPVRGIRDRHRMPQQLPNLDYLRQMIARNENPSEQERQARFQDLNNDTRIERRLRGLDNDEFNR